MNVRTAVIGDVHGNVQALRALLELVRRSADRIVLAGDYVNRGPSSADVLETLATWKDEPRLTCLAGNHDRSMLAYLDGDDRAGFLRMGGVSTILSYVGPVSGDVAEKFRRAVPASHVDLLRSFGETYESHGLVVSHGPLERIAAVPQYNVYGHIVQRSLVPDIREHAAAIDTGCGTLPAGRLSALFWPDMEVIQVGPTGEPLPNGER